MSFQVDWLQEHKDKKIEQGLLDTIDKCLQDTGELTGTVEGEFSVVFVDEIRIQEINREYRNIDKPTDVISFALNDDLEENEQIEELSFHLGDIVICVDIAEHQAMEYGHAFEREMCFLAIHGLLHLLGYDHETIEQEKEMFTIQETILKNRGLL